MKKYVYSEWSLICLAFITLYIPIAFFSYKAENRLEASLDNAKKAKINLTFSDYVPDPIPDKENATIKIEEAIEAFKDIDPNWAEQFGDEFNDFAGAIFESEKILILDEASLNYIKNGLMQFKHPLEIFAESLVRNKAWSEKDYANPKVESKYNIVAREQILHILLTQAYIDLCGGNHLESYKTMSSLFRYCRFMDIENPYSGYLNSMILFNKTCYALASLCQILPPNAEERLWITKEMDAYNPLEIAKRGMQCQMAYQLTLYRKKVRSKLILHTLFLKPSIFWGYMGASQSASLDLFIKLFPMNDKLSLFNEIKNNEDNLKRSIPPWAIFARRSLSNFPRIAKDRDEALVYQDLMRLYFALCDCKERFGDYPADLQQLKQKMNIPVPLDRFTGNALQYKKNASGYILYSVGYDQLDDMGESIINPFNEDTEGDIAWFVSSQGGNK